MGTKYTAGGQGPLEFGGFSQVAAGWRGDSVLARFWRASGARTPLTPYAPAAIRQVSP